MPDRFVGSVVSITGTVDRILNVPIIGVSICSVSDGNTTIIAILTSHHSVGDHIKIHARVLGVSKSKSLADTQPIVEAVAGFLVDHKFARKGRAETASKAVLRVVGTVAGSIKGSYFLLQQDK